MSLCKATAAEARFPKGSLDYLRRAVSSGSRVILQDYALNLDEVLEESGMPSGYMEFKEDYVLLIATK